MVFKEEHKFMFIHILPLKLKIVIILRHQLPEEAENSLREIQGQLKLYEDDNAERLLGRLLDRLGGRGQSR